jgi:serine/threonine protein kinase
VSVANDTLVMPRVLPEDDNSGSIDRNHCKTFAIPCSDVVVGAYIGKGAFGDVRRGAWRGRAVAIKALSAAACDSSAHHSQSKDMLKEIELIRRALSTVRHPNIVGFYGICVDSRQPWLIMEYVGGGSVEDFLARRETCYKKLRSQALTLALDLARGLDYLHSQEPVIIHRDIKPGNLMLTEGLEHLKLCDFGVSTTMRMKMCDRESAGTAAADGKHLTDALYYDKAIGSSAWPTEMEAGVKGSYRYMAPEVFTEHTPFYDSAVDIYSAALSIWVLFLGQRPFTNLDGLTVARLASRQYLRPPLQKKAIPSSVAQLLEGAWHRDPAQRPCASDMVLVLEGALRREGAHMLPSISSAMTRKLFRRRSSNGPQEHVVQKTRNTVYSQQRERDKNFTFPRVDTLSSLCVPNCVIQTKPS